MGESFKSEKIVRDYLLGRVSDETTLEGIEELLFTDEEFCSQVALAEDDLINDYVCERLAHADTESFRATLSDNPERSFKLQLTQGLRERALSRELKVAEEKPSFFASLKAFFSQPQYAGAVAVLLIAVVGLAIYLNRRGHRDDLAELRSVYQRARPTETRISEFGYAPLSQLRGAPEPGDEKRLRRIENSLIETTEKTPNAETHHALGVFYLTQQKYRESIKEFETALKSGAQNAKIHNDLGAAYFELSKAEPKTKKLEDLAQSLEEFTKAIDLDGSFLEALFNKSLVLQELGLSHQAKESWNLYLQKDPTSDWAAEARKNLARIENEQPRAKTDQEVLSDFLIAYHNHDDARAQKIHNETKGLLRSVTVPLQLARRYLLARRRGDEAEAKESIEALVYLGNSERTQIGDSFFFELATFYTAVGAEHIDPLLQAQEAFTRSYQFIGHEDYRKVIAGFENSRDLFARLGDVCEAAVAENWAVQFLPDVGRIADSRERLNAIIAQAASRKFHVLLPSAYYWLGVGDFLQKRISESGRNLRTALRLAEAGNNIFEVHHAEECLASDYSELGELQPALFYASRMLPEKDSYYEPRSQSLRNKGTLVDLTLRLQFYSTSLSLSKEGLAIAREDAPASLRLCQSLGHMVRAASGKEDYVSALQYAGESKAIALALPDTSENIRTLAEIYLSLGDLKSKTKDYQEALPDYDQALALYGRLPEFTFETYRIHKGKLFCFQQLDLPEDFSSELKIVLNLSEEYRETIREDDSRQAFFASEQAVFDAAATNSIKQHDSPGAFDFVEQSKARSLLDFVSSSKSIAQVEKQFAAVARPLALAEIQSRLPAQVELVQYAMLPDRLAIWILSRERLDFVERQITATALAEKIGAYQTLIVANGAPADIRSAGRELHDLLIPQNLGAGKQLCLVPDKSMHQLSFATLVSPAGKYLLEDFALFYSPSASVLVLATENARRKEQVTNESLLSVGNPDFDREANPGLPDLRDAEAEARSITSGYKKSMALLGADATKERFLLNFANVEVIHFAGHFVANRQSPGNSKLLFAGGELRSAELSCYKLTRAKLVVLSACETGFERSNESEGAIGVARTLLALGAPLVVASQWKVDSETTKDLMIAFHRNRKQSGTTSAESLRRAQLELLGRDQTKAPFYWAAFSLFGGYANY
jgi:CHAT domain-containing protein